MQTIPLVRSDIPGDTVELARFLLGKRIVRIESDAGSNPEPMVLRIVETEAYPPGDEACHAYRRMTQRNRSLFLQRGHAYVYRAYGVCWMLNVSSETAGVGAGVLLRAGQPEAGIDAMRRHRTPGAPRDLVRGPGRLAQAMAIDRRLDGQDLCAGGTLFLARGDAPAPAIGVSPRIGITRAVAQPWRFFEQGSAFLSGPAWLNTGTATAECHGAPRRRVARSSPTRYDAA